MKKNNYRDFLHDESFIFWRLTGDEELDAYWKDYLLQNPDLQSEFEKAIREFSIIRLNDDRLTDEEYFCLQQRIKKSAAQVGEKRRIYRLVKYAAAACLALIVTSSAYFMYLNHDAKKQEIYADMIIGESLDKEDISLITSSKTTTFSKDIIVSIDGEGSAVIQEIDNQNSTKMLTETTEMNTLVVPYGKRSQLELSDGTKVWLNSGSILEFPTLFAGNTREINLTGEIYIEVAEDNEKPFLINTSDFQVKVYGTKFNVSAYKDTNTQSIVLLEGCVSVKSAASGEDFLKPNDMLIYNNNHWNKQQVDVMKYVSWKDGYIILDQAPITDVLKQVEKYYNLSFDIQKDLNLESKTCTGRIYLFESLDDVMTTISLLSSTRYTRENKNIYIEINP